RAGMVFMIADDLHAASVGQYGVALGNVFACVICTLGLNVRAVLVDESANVWFIEDHDCIHVCQGCNNLGTILGRHQGTSLALQLPHAGIGIHGDNQFAAQGLGSVEIAHMPNVQQVETAVGQHDLLAVAPPLGDPRVQCGTGKDL